jgi:oligoendopeptidase F
MATNEAVWDLSQLVETTDTSSILNKLDSTVADAEKLREKYYGKILYLDAKSVLDLLQAIDDYHLKFEATTLYCQLKYLADSTDPVAKQLNSASSRASVQAKQTLAFIDIELGKLLVAKPSLVSDPVLAEFRHHLERKLRRSPHVLSEIEERLIIAKNKNGISAWQLLQSEWLSARSFEFEVNGAKRTMPYGEIVGYFRSPNRELRRRSHQTVYEGLGKDEVLFASAIRSICDDYLLMCKWRKYPTTMSPSLIDNDVDQETINSLMLVVLRNLELYRHYLEVKARLMGLDKLANYDILAPLPNAPETRYGWQEARTEITAAYNRFDREVGSWIEEMYDMHHIDGQVRKGKRAGAFSSTWIAGKSAYVSQSFHGTVGDLYTLAHELGHAIHDYLATRAQKPCNLEVGKCIAETGSIFGELLLTDRLLLKPKSKEEKQAILAAILDEFGVTVFRVSARFLFEQSLYDTIEKGGFLDGDTIARLWMQARDKIYGNSVDWLEAMKWEWTVQLHYFKADFRFYNYPYVFAQLFVFTLYQLYKEQDATFVHRLKRLLAAGSSKSPLELANEIGLDITDQTFWQKGMIQAHELIEALEQTL